MSHSTSRRSTGRAPQHKVGQGFEISELEIKNADVKPVEKSMTELRMAQAE